MSSPTCVVLGPTSVCGASFAGVAVAAPSAAEFDARVSEQLSALPAACPNSTQPATAKVQFAASVQCSAAAAACAQPGASANAALSFALCAVPCRQHVESLQQMLSLGSCDMRAANSLVIAAAQTCDAVIPLQNPSSTPRCWPGVDREVAACGFADVAAACALDSLDSPCCSGGRPVVSVLAFSPSAPKATTTTNNNNNIGAGSSDASPPTSSSGGPNIAAVVGAIVGCLVLLIALGIIAYYRRNSKKSKRRVSTPILSSIKSIPPSTPPTAILAESPLPPISSSGHNNTNNTLQIFPTSLSPSSAKHNSSDVEFFRTHSQKINAFPGNVDVSESLSITPLRLSENNQNSFDAVRGSGSTSNESHRIFRVIHNYRPNMKDELRLVLGASIAVVKEYPDGWADGIDILTGDRGVLPMSCVTDPETYLQKQALLQSTNSSTNPPPVVRVSRRKSSLSIPGTAAATNVSDKPDRTNSTGSNSSTSSKMYTVIREYAPLRDDELKLEFGKDVILLKSFEDGWGKGYEPQSGSIGMFPLTFVVRKEEKETVLGEDAEKLAATIQLSTRSSSLSEMNESYVKTKADVMEAIGEEGEAEGNPDNSATYHVLSFDGFLRVKVVHPYSSTKEDELELCVGMEVILLKEFKDGWGRGQSVETGVVGMFPLVCVA